MDLRMDSMISGLTEMPPADIRTLTGSLGDK